MKKKLIAALTACLMLSLTVPATALAAGFVQDTAGVKFQNDDGSFAANTWVQVLNNIYHLDENGYVQFGWIQTGDLWYYLDQNGVCTNPLGQSAPPAEQPTTNEEHSLTAEEIQNLASLLDYDDYQDLMLEYSLRQLQERNPINWDTVTIECTPVYSDSRSANLDFDGMTHDGFAY